jgi:hypothetical protein
MNRSLSKLTFSSSDGDLTLQIEASMMEADFSRTQLGASGAMILSTFLPKCNGAMTSLNLASNMTGSGGAEHVAEAIKVSECVAAFFVYQCPSDQWFNLAVVCHFRRIWRH